MTELFFSDPCFIFISLGILFQVESGNAETVALFLEILNEALQEYKGSNIIFNPLGWMLDEGGGLQAGLVSKYGPEVKSKIATCR